MVRLADGRITAAPIEGYPRLVHGTPEERSNHDLAYLGES